MRCIFVGLGVAVVAGVAAGQNVTRTDDGQGPIIVEGVMPQGGGSPLRLEYTCEDMGGGFYAYEFELIVDNNDGSYVPGQGWGWIIFGDQQGQPSNLTNFIGDLDSLPAGPFTQFQDSGGFHNGPTLGPVSVPDGMGGFMNNIWTPKGEGDSICWAGSSTASLDDGELLFSTLMLDGGALPADFQPGVKVGGDDPCVADCNGDGNLDILDFVCFQSLWQTQAPEGDCDGNGQFNVLDFVCFQGVFSEGCD